MTLQESVRPIAVYTMLAVTAYLAVIGNERAQETLLLQFIAVVSFYFGQRQGEKDAKARESASGNEGSSRERAPERGKDGQEGQSQGEDAPGNRVQ